ncbi:1378_t:CDS:2 [Funneliformis geosporum]|uniref:5456_t:CDS:1 n=1 Tax=Funneliformis geosporum TaxID=1117311 RepID=A0A9W4WJF1_9GLOM|nr:1378_t:CDS:2 [Funneliformis geosporum]CAI2166309.1 5456_t:CDS:2 [Funneliformis geosporum]
MLWSVNLIDLIPFKLALWQSQILTMVDLTGPVQSLEVKSWILVAETNVDYELSINSNLKKIYTYGNANNGAKSYFFIIELVIELEVQ